MQKPNPSSKPQTAFQEISLTENGTSATHQGAMNPENDTSTSPLETNEPENGTSTPPEAINEAKNGTSTSPHAIIDPENATLTSLQTKHDAENNASNSLQATHEPENDVSANEPEKDASANEPGKDASANESGEDGSGSPKATHESENDDKTSQNQETSNHGSATTLHSIVLPVCAAIGSVMLLAGMAFLIKRNLPQKTIPKDTLVHFNVIRSHYPGLDDEIQLNIGDVVIVQEKFDDGWAFGLNIMTDCEGCFPLSSVSQLDTPDNNETEQAQTQLSRASSLYKHSLRIAYE